MRCVHQMRFGAVLHPGSGSATFGLWAPAARQVELLLHAGPTTQALPATPGPDGFCSVAVELAKAALRYQWRIDHHLVVPDPASRSNPSGPHGPSELTSPTDFEWDEGWRGRPWHQAVFYEMHVGTFTPEGSFACAAARLPELAALGVTAVQLMPLADFPGRFGWGYDGVLPFAPYHGYGTPDDLKQFVQAAHRLGLMVLGDVVYNHFGPDGNYLHAYAPQFFSRRHRSPWGAGLNFDDEGSAIVREFFIANALYWLQEFRFDGLRLDAVHAIVDDGQPHFLEELSVRVRDACVNRHVHLVLENDSNDARWLAAPGGRGRYDGQWNGDVHHALHVLLTGERAGYYGEYDRPLEQLARCLTHGFARQGGPHNAPNAPPRRHAQGRVPLSSVINFLQNHDQIGNRAQGERLLALADPAALRLATAILAMAPSPWMLFMGEEWGARAPFQYFADWQGDLGEAVRRGRREEFAAFAADANAIHANGQVATKADVPDPCSRATFERSRLEAASARSGDAASWHAFYADLLARRARVLTPQLPALCDSGHQVDIDGPVLDLQWAFGPAADRHVWRMQVNLSAQPAPCRPLPAGTHPELSIADAQHDTLGPWSGRWFWVGPSPAACDP